MPAWPPLPDAWIRTLRVSLPTPDGVQGTLCIFLCGASFFQRYALKSFILDSLPGTLLFKMTQKYNISTGIFIGLAQGQTSHEVPDAGVPVGIGSNEQHRTLMLSFRSGGRADPISVDLLIFAAS